MKDKKDQNIHWMQKVTLARRVADLGANMPGPSYPTTKVSDEMKRK